MELVALLFNAKLLTLNIITKGVLAQLFPPHQKQINKVDIEGICKLLRKCGKSLDVEDTKLIDEYLQLLVVYAKKCDDKIIKLVDDIKKLRNSQWLKNEEIQSKYNELEEKYRKIFLKQKAARMEMTELMEQYKWMKESDFIKQKYNELEMNQEPTNSEMNNLIDDYMELQTNYIELEQRYNTLSATKKRKYKEWNTKEIVVWIVERDKERYKKYTDQLMENMMKEGIDGKCLEKIDKNDLHRFGIEQFSDKCDIFNSLQELIKTSRECPFCKNMI